MGRTQKGEQPSRLDPARIDTAEKIYRDKVVPLAKQFGVSQLTLMVDPATGRTVSVAMWNSGADAKAYEASGGFKDAIALFGDMFVEADFVYAACGFSRRVWIEP